MLWGCFRFVSEANAENHMETPTHTGNYSHMMVFWTKSICCVEGILRQEDKRGIQASVYSQHADTE